MRPSSATARADDLLAGRPVEDVPLDEDRAPAQALDLGDHGLGLRRPLAVVDRDVGPGAAPAPGAAAADPRAAPVTIAVLPRSFMRFGAPWESPEFGEEDSRRSGPGQVTTRQMARAPGPAKRRRPSHAVAGPRSSTPRQKAGMPS